MIATYAAVLAVCGASLVIGQAAIALCGARRWSWLSPAVGFALVCAVCWATVRLPGDGLVSALFVLVLTIAAVAFLVGRLEGGGEALRAGLPLGLLALAAVSLPFAVEGHFGILGTGFNPDMSQHLLATDRLAEGVSGQLLREGYPLGPHAVVVALNKGLGIGLVQGFTGLTVAIAVLAPLTALAALVSQPPMRRTAAALLVGLAYLVASYYAQGAFKETAQALLVLAFLLALRESNRAWQAHPLRFIPAAVLAIGTVYVYSFPGLIWLLAIAAIWALMDSVARRSSAGGVGGGVSGRVRPDAPPAATGPAATTAASLAAIVFAIGALPELGRMIDFASFETFDPRGPGLGNLFGQVSPFTALGIWPSGDFRVAPGDGAAPAFAFYLGAAFATILLAAGLARCVRRREHVVLAGLATVLAVYLATRIGGTPYTAAKALEIAAPVLTLAIILPLVSGDSWRLSRPIADQSANRVGVGGLAVSIYALAAGGCSLLALANAPVGPATYSPALTGLRPLLGDAPTLVLAPDELLDERHGARYIAWELRGGRVCIEREGAAGAAPPPGVRFVVTTASRADPPFPGLTLRHRAGPYTLWERRGVRGGPDPCPRIAVRQGAVSDE
ncbi:MAG TPA: hypothetical protein VFC52_03350 [Solirubrobacterales bacterium]|nr:hypothetical protein [Solirubrobacterales bacterium]